MRAIVKGAEPKSLTQHRESGRDPEVAVPATYEEYKEKDDLRVPLVTEQRGLCCYCMRPIRPEASSMKVEHWACQHAHPSQQLDYSNMLAACMGGERRGVKTPREQLHCDTRKGGSDIRWNPSNPAHAIEAHVWYEPDGTIRSSDDVFDEQLGRRAGEGALNLNLVALRNSRAGVLAEIAGWWKREKAVRKGPVPKDAIVRQLNKWTEGLPLRPFCGVATWALRQRLAKVA